MAKREIFHVVTMDCMGKPHVVYNVKKRFDDKCVCYLIMTDGKKIKGSLENFLDVGTSLWFEASTLNIQANNVTLHRGCVLVVFSFEFEEMPDDLFDFILGMRSFIQGVWKSSVKERSLEEEKKKN